MQAVAPFNTLSLTSESAINIKQGLPLIDKLLSPRSSMVALGSPAEGLFEPRPNQDQ